ncbi:conjugal transfer protein TraF [Hydrogenovibrio marinus]|uniref:Conjugal transfer protein TraF n=1 Tax=Hydrogenovibrio marinus TaxID=28885 RepID=A0A066ZLQ0_HYDMR|nr:conjugal transfer protein TraF [Hydrogenovibrio marinus]KDN94723.1 hypothetical protein EI16_12570 [Hydrogenovibrio marinus]
MRLSGFFFFSMTMMLLANKALANDFDYHSAFKCNGQEKFTWYCEEEKKKPVKKAPAPKPSPVKTAKKPVEEPTPLTEEQKDLAEFERIKKTLKEKRKIAYVNPTNKNMKDYISYQNFVTKKAAVFTDKWKRVIWQDPTLDYSQKFPVAKIAKTTNLEQRDKAKMAAFQKLKQEGYGIFFFYRSGCEYCKAMASPMQYFQSFSKMDVLPITIDGVKDEELFPGSIVDHGQAHKLHVTQTPSIFLVNPKTRKIVPIAYGWVSVNDLEKRIFVLTNTKPGENY